MAPVMRRLVVLWGCFFFAVVRVGGGSSNAAALIDSSVRTLEAGRSSESQEMAARQLMDLAYECPENVASIMGSGALEPLVKLLQEGSVSAREAAAGALMDLSLTAADRVAVVRGGAIRPCVSLLEVPDDPAAREAAAGLLSTLVLVARAGVIGPLVKLVGDFQGDFLGNGTAAGNAAWALARLAEDHGDAHLALSIARAGAAEPLVALVASRRAAPSALASAAEAISAISAADPEIAREFVACGALEPLAAAIAGGADEDREAAAVDALAALLASGMSSSFSSSSSTTPPFAPPLADLVRLLGDGTPRARRGAARALYALSNDVGVRETLVLHHEVVAPLERLLVDDEVDAKLVAAAALRNLVVAADVSDLVKVARAQHDEAPEATTRETPPRRAAYAAGLLLVVLLLLLLPRLPGAAPVVGVESKDAATGAPTPTKGEASPTFDDRPSKTFEEALEAEREAHAATRRALADAEAERTEDRARVAEALAAKADDVARLVAALDAAEANAAARERAADVRERAADVLIDEHVHLSESLKRATADLADARRAVAELQRENAELKDANRVVYQTSLFSDPNDRPLPITGHGYCAPFPGVISPPKAPAGPPPPP